MDSCVFCQIVSGRLEACKVYEDDSSLCFLDIRPLFFGHCLLIPKGHFETFRDLPVSLIGPLFELGQRLVEAVESALDAGGSFVAINNKISQSVPHLHIHIVPRRKGDGLKGFFWPRTKYGSPTELESVAALIRDQLKSR